VDAYDQFGADVYALEVFGCSEVDGIITAATQVFLLCF